MMRKTPTNCALEMHEKQRGMLSAGLLDFPEVHHRIGIHFGTCVVGNTGSNKDRILL